MARKLRRLSKPRKFARRRQRTVTPSDGLQSLREWFLPNDRIFSHLTFHGNTKWSPESLVWLAICWAWSESRNLTDAFDEAAGWCERMFASTIVSTYQGFMHALTVWTSPWMPILRGRLQRCAERIGGRFWTIGGWIPMALDGSRSTVPRTASNELAFCAPRYGQSNKAKYRQKKRFPKRRSNPDRPPQPQEPQVWVTLFWHMGFRLPWTWRLGPSHASERAHAMEVMDAEEFPENTLFCGDAGFTGYPLWSRMVAEGHNFLVRIGANVKLLSEHADWTTTSLKKDAPVLCWPQGMMRAGRPPLRLRLLQVRIGKTQVWLLTSVLEQSQLSAKLAIQFYRMRWGVEVEFRGLKQTLDRATLRCRTAKRLLVELEWSILAMAIAELWALKEQQSCKPSKQRCASSDPARRSLAKIMRTLRNCLRHLDTTHDLKSQLRSAVTDNYQRKRSKKARYRPPNKDKKPLGDPTVRKITRIERQLLKTVDKRIAL